MRDNIKKPTSNIVDSCWILLRFETAAMLMSKKKKKQEKAEHGDTEKALEEDKAYSTRELEEDF